MLIYSILIYYCIVQHRMYTIVRTFRCKKVLIGDTGGYGHYVSSAKIAELVFNNNDNLILWIGWQKRFGSAKVSNFISNNLNLIDLSFDLSFLKWYNGTDKERQFISSKLKRKLIDKGIDARKLSDIYSAMESENNSSLSPQSQFCYQSICVGESPSVTDATIILRDRLEREYGIDFDSSLVIYLRDKGKNTKDVTNWGRIGSPWIEYIETLKFALNKKLNIFIIGDNNLDAIKFFKSQINSKLILNPNDLKIENSLFTTIATMCSKYYLGDMGGNNLLRSYVRKNSLIINGFPPNNLVPYSTISFKKIYFDNKEVINLTRSQINQIDKIELKAHNKNEIFKLFKFYFQDINKKIYDIRLKDVHKSKFYYSQKIEIKNSRVKIL
jgi:hypothetical protein